MDCHGAYDPGPDPFDLVSRFSSPRVFKDRSLAYCTLSSASLNTQLYPLLFSAKSLIGPLSSSSILLSRLLRQATSPRLVLERHQAADHTSK